MSPALNKYQTEPTAFDVKIDSAFNNRLFVLRTIFRYILFCLLFAFLVVKDIDLNMLASAR